VAVLARRSQGPQGGRSCPGQGGARRPAEDGAGQGPPRSALAIPQWLAETRYRATHGGPAPLPRAGQGGQSPAGRAHTTHARHLATRLFENKVETRVVQEIIGHENIATTEITRHCTETDAGVFAQDARQGDETASDDNARRGGRVRRFAGQLCGSSRSRRCCIASSRPRRIIHAEPKRSADSSGAALTAATLLPVFHPCRNRGLPTKVTRAERLGSKNGRERCYPVPISTSPSPCPRGTAGRACAVIQIDRLRRVIEGRAEAQS